MVTGTPARSASSRWLIPALSRASCRSAEDGDGSPSTSYGCVITQSYDTAGGGPRPPRPGGAAPLAAGGGGGGCGGAVGIPAVRRPPVVRGSPGSLRGGTEGGRFRGLRPGPRRGAGEPGRGPG